MGYNEDKRRVLELSDSKIFKEQLYPNRSCYIYVSENKKVGLVQEYKTKKLIIYSLRENGFVYANSTKNCLGSFYKDLNKEEIFELIRLSKEIGFRNFNDLTGITL